MKAAVRDRYGTPDVVRIEEVERPEPSGAEVLIRVSSASVNRADLDGITPRPQFVRLFFGLRRPRNRWLGLDVAGVVEALGPDVTRFRVGDRVFGDLFTQPRGGAFAEYVVASERALLAIPDGLSYDEAATLPHSAVLAMQGLRRRDGRTIGPGDRVLIDGASGNVGPFAVQIAKHLGAEVTGVASPAKLDFVRSLGADHVIDYTAVDYTRTGERYDWILDTDSHHPIRAVRRALRPNGVYVTLGGTAWPIISALLFGSLASLRSDRWSGLLLWWKPFHEPDVRRILDLIASGAVRPAIDRRFALDDIVKALQHVEDGKARGKVLVSV